MAKELIYLALVEHHTSGHGKRKAVYEVPSWGIKVGDTVKISNSLGDETGKVLSVIHTWEDDDEVVFIKELVGLTGQRFPRVTAIVSELPCEYDDEKEAAVNE